MTIASRALSISHDACWNGQEILRNCTTAFALCCQVPGIGILDQQRLHNVKEYS